MSYPIAPDLIRRTYETLFHHAHPDTYIAPRAFKNLIIRDTHPALG